MMGFELAYISLATSPPTGMSLATQKSVQFPNAVADKDARTFRLWLTA